MVNLLGSHSEDSRKQPRSVFSIDPSYELLSKTKRSLVTHLFEREIGSQKIMSSAYLSHDFFIHRRLIESRCPVDHDPEKMFVIQSNPTRTRMQLVGNQIFSQSSKYSKIFVYRPKLHNQELDRKTSLEFQGALDIPCSTIGKKVWQTFNVWEDNSMTMGQVPTLIGLSKCGFYMDFIGFDDQKFLQEVRLHQTISYSEITTNEEHSLLILGANKATLDRNIVSDYIVFHYPPILCKTHLQVMPNAFRSSARFELMGPFGMVCEGQNVSVYFLEHIIEFASTKDVDDSSIYPITHRLFIRPPVLFTIKTTEFYLDMDENAFMPMCVSQLGPGHFKVWGIDGEPFEVGNGEISSVPTNQVAGHTRLISTFSEDFQTDTLDFFPDGSPRMIHKTTNDIRILRIVREEDENRVKGPPKLDTEFIIDFNTSKCETGEMLGRRTSGRSKKKNYNFGETFVNYCYNCGLDLMGVVKVTPHEIHMLIYDPKDWHIVKEFKSLLSSFKSQTQDLLDIKEFSFNDDFIVLELRVSHSNVEFIFINLLSE